MKEIDSEILEAAREAGLDVHHCVMVMTLVDGRDVAWRAPRTMGLAEARSYVGLMACHRDVDTATLLAESPQRGVRIVDQVSFTDNT